MPPARWNFSFSHYACSHCLDINNLEELSSLRANVHILGSLTVYLSHTVSSPLKCTHKHTFMRAHLHTHTHTHITAWFPLGVLPGLRLRSTDPNGCTQIYCWVYFPSNWSICSIPGNQTHTHGDLEKFVICSPQVIQNIEVLHTEMVFTEKLHKLLWLCNRSIEMNPAQKLQYYKCDSLSNVISNVISQNDYLSFISIISFVD